MSRSGKFSNCRGPIPGIHLFLSLSVLLFALGSIFPAVPERNCFSSVSDSVSDPAPAPVLDLIPSPSPMPPERQRSYYLQALKNYDKNCRRLKKDGPWDIFSVRIPADYLYALVSVEQFFRENPDLRVEYASERIYPLEKSAEIAQWIRTMQDLSPDSPFQGNFRWYWRQQNVEDRNAAEFVVKRLIFCWAHRNVLPEECREIIRVILKDAAPECLRRRPRPDYTNISVMNFANLLLLGEAFQDAELHMEGMRRMNRFLFQTWRSGIHEFATPTYFNEIFETLEQLRELTQSEEVRGKAELLLNYCALLTALHFTQDGRFGGACSRTYAYLYGDDYLRFHVGVWGWIPLPQDRSNISILTALNGKYVPDPETLRALLPAEMRDCTICERWGLPQSEWKKTYRTQDFILGVSMAKYNSHQDQLWTLDWLSSGKENADSISDPYAKTSPRCSFMPDGRGDPWGTNREITNGGHKKALHLDPDWSASLDGPRAECRAVYTSDEIRKFRKTSPGQEIRSTFILKKPDSVYFQDPDCLHAVYGKNRLELKITHLSAGHISPELLPSPDGNAVAWCIVHTIPPETEKEIPDPIELVFRSEIHPLDSVSENAAKAPSVPESCALPQSGSSTLRSALESDFFQRPTGWEGPAGILTVNGTEIGRRFLEKSYPPFADYAATQRRWISEIAHIWEVSEKRTHEQSIPEALPKDLPILVLNAGEKFRLPVSAGLFFEDFAVGSNSVSQCIEIQNETFFRLWVQTPGTYRLSAKVLAPDPQHDSLQITYWTPEKPEGVHFPCWALDSSPNWRTVEFRAPDQRAPAVELELPRGPVLLKLAPREFDVQLQELEFRRIP